MGQSPNFVPADPKSLFGVSRGKTQEPPATAPADPSGCCLRYCLHVCHFRGKTQQTFTRLVGLGG